MRIQTAPMIFPSISATNAKSSFNDPIAYKLIRQMNEELEAKGFITIAGRVSRKYYEEKFYGMAQGVRTSSHTPVAVAK